MRTVRQDDSTQRHVTTTSNVTTKRRRSVVAKKPASLIPAAPTGIAETGVRVLLDLLGPVTASEIRAARNVIARQKGNGSTEAAELSPLLEAYFAGRAAS